MNEENIFSLENFGIERNGICYSLDFEQHVQQKTHKVKRISQINTFKSYEAKRVNVKQIRLNHEALPFTVARSGARPRGPNG